MSLIRPELRAAIWRRREEIFCVLVILWAVRLLGRGYDIGSVTQMGLGIGVAGLFSVLLFYAHLRARMHRQGQEAAGMVIVNEREIGFMGPESGAFVSLDDLTRLEILTRDSGPVEEDVFWILTHLAGPPLLIPASAKGAEQLFDAIAPLPGVDYDAVARAMGTSDAARFLIWERSH